MQNQYYITLLSVTNITNITIIIADGKRLRFVRILLNDSTEYHCRCANMYYTDK